MRNHDRHGCCLARFRMSQRSCCFQQALQLADVLYLVRERWPAWRRRHAIAIYPNAACQPRIHSPLYVCWQAVAHVYGLL
jgi:hypothetical protein